MIVTNYITRLVILVNLFTIHDIHHIGIIQRPRDHLFQKSWHLDATLVHNEQKSTNLSFFFMVVIKYMTRLVIWVNLFKLYVIHHIGIIQRPHDHLFQKWGHLDATWVAKIGKQAKIDKFEIFSLRLKPNLFPDGLYWSICSYSM